MQLRTDVIPLKKYKAELEISRQPYYRDSDPEPRAILAIQLPGAEAKKHYRAFADSSYEMDGVTAAVRAARMAYIPALVQEESQKQTAYYKASEGLLKALASGGLISETQAKLLAAKYHELASKKSTSSKGR